MSKSVFISRQLNKDSIFKKGIENKGLTLFHQSLIQFSSLKMMEIPSTNIHFFYSKKGVEFAIEDSKLKALMYQKKLAAIGQGTASLLQENGFNVDFIGTGQPKETAQLLDDFYPNQSILFLRAVHSKQSVQQLLSDPKRVFDLAIYSNTIKENIHIPSCDILVFTSPMNAQAYFQNYQLQQHQQVIAIGQTTATALYNIGIQNVIISKTPSETALVDAVMELNH